MTFDPTPEQKAARAVHLLKEQADDKRIKDEQQAIEDEKRKVAQQKIAELEPMAKEELTASFAQFKEKFFEVNKIIKNWEKSGKDFYSPLILDLREGLKDMNTYRNHLEDVAKKYGLFGEDSKARISMKNIDKDIAEIEGQLPQQEQKKKAT